jgi:hypothetical protein
VDDFAETSTDIKRYLTGPSGVGSATIATGTFQPGMLSSDADGNGPVDAFAGTCSAINRYLFSSQGEGSADIATGSFCS